MGTCTLIAEQLNASQFALAELNASYQELLASVDSSAAVPDDPCAFIVPPNYSQPYHISAIFIVLVASALGTAVPLLGSHIAVFAVDPFLLVLGKCAGTGVVLACGFIHMLQPSNESLTNSCLSSEL